MPINERYINSEKSVSTIADGAATSPAGRLCSAVAGHMLALHRAEAAHQAAVEWGNENAIGEAASAVAMHCARIIEIVHGPDAAGLSRQTIHAALAIFPPQIVASIMPALPVPEMKPTAKKLDLPTGTLPAPTGPLAAGGAPDAKALALIARAGRRGASRTDLLMGVAPHIKSSALAAVVRKLEAEGAIISVVMQPKPSGRPGTRFFLGSGGPLVTAPDGSVVLASVRPRQRMKRSNYRRGANSNKPELTR